jgi:hypothetical protein
VPAHKLESLERLAALYKDGLLTRAEYDQQKAAILGSDDAESKADGSDAGGAAGAVPEADGQRPDPSVRRPKRMVPVAALGGGAALLLTAVLAGRGCDETVACDATLEYNGQTHVVTSWGSSEAMATHAAVDDTRLLAELLFMGAAEADQLFASRDLPAPDLQRTSETQLLPGAVIEAGTCRTASRWAAGSSFSWRFLPWNRRTLSWRAVAFDPRPDARSPVRSSRSLWPAAIQCPSAEVSRATFL